jgi:lauroyl/myristoyl acyltransferase
MSLSPDSKSRWKSFRYRLEWVLCGLLANGIPILPRRACVLLANVVGSLAFYLDSRGRAVALANLKAVFKGRYSEAERRVIARRSYQNFVRTMVDLFWARRLNAKNWRDYILTDMTEETAAKLYAGRGSVSMCVHWGNFEWASLAFGFVGIPTQIVAENFKNTLVSDYFNRAREISGHTIIPQENSMIRLLKVAKKHGATGMLVDLTMPPSQASVVIEAFGLKMSTTLLHSVLVQRGGAQMIRVDGEPLPDGRCRVVVHEPLAIPPDASLQEITQACWSAFEQRILQEPEKWMWPYKHWRYRPREAKAEDYPFYANISSKFEKVLQKQAQEKAERLRGKVL